ncbi:uncharacterized protein isoform X2 [Leptinotarsa decemlineata]
MNNNSRAALILQLASKKCNEQNICNQNAEDQNILHTQCMSPSIIENIREPFCTDGNTTSDKENVYFEDSDDSVKDPNFKIDCGYTSSTSGSSVGRPTIRKRVKRNSPILSEEKHQTQPYVNIGVPENLAVTPSTSKNISHRKRSISSDSSSSTSSSNSSSNSSSSSISSSNTISKSRSSETRCSSNDTVLSSLPCNQENVPNNNVPEQIMSPVRKSGKKRKSCVNEWLSNKAKILRNTGKPYTSRSKSQKKMSARCLKPPCGEKCKLKCIQKINDVNRSKIFENYWQLGDLAAQRNFIHKNMKAIIPAFRFTGKIQPRKLNHSFYFQINEEPIRVCKTFFRATLDINDRVIRTVIEKSKDGFLEQDMRGKHGNHSKVAESIRQGIRDHINSIPRMESHYIRKNSSREYIDGGKSLNDLYRDYKTLCDSNNVPYANETLYSRIFNGEFNISFFKPKKDRCELCVRYENAQGDTKKDLEVQYLKHIEEKDLSRIEKDADKKTSGPNKIIAIYDLQAVLQVPRGNTSIFYYKSKLNTLNFTVSLISDDKTDCFYWHEGEANRGADEIGSCLFKFIQNRVVNYDGPGLDLIFYSDNCCGQNKNRFIISIYLYALLKFPRIKSITHKYLITGHTQNEADSVHSTIEKQIQRRLRSGPIYVPSQYVEAIKSAKKKGNPYTVTEMSSTDFYSLKRLSEDIGLTIAKSFKISEVKIFKLMQDDPTKLLFKTSFKDHQFSETVLTRKKNLNSISLKLAYRSKPKLKENKLKDLLDLLHNNHIPTFYESFYKSLR